MPGELAGAGGADLAVVVHGLLGLNGAVRTTLWEIGYKIGVQGLGTLRQHGGEISMEEWAC